MDNNFVGRNEHEEMLKRMEAEHDRQNHRISELEKAMKNYGTLTVSIERMAVTMEQMLKEQISQGERLDELESRDGEMWRKVVSYAVTAIVGVAIGLIFKNI